MPKDKRSLPDTSLGWNACFTLKLLLSSSHLQAPSSARRVSFYRMWTVAVMDSERRGPGAIEIIASLEILVIWPYLKIDGIPNKKTKTFFFQME